MAILSNIPNFDLAFYEGTDETEYKFNLFFEAEDEIADVVPSVVVKENITLKLRFRSPYEKSRLYIDGLDAVQDHSIEEDEHGVPYIKPNNDIIKLFEGSDYPLVPGFYRAVIVHENKTYYSIFQVVPTRLTVAQWELLRNELEQDLKGLAQDLVRRNLGLGMPVTTDAPLPPQFLFYFLVIQKRFSAIMSALNDLIDKPSFKIRKEYHWFNLERSKVIDEKTIRSRLTHPEITNLYHVPIREIYYDLPENRWIKKIFRFLNTCLCEFDSAVDGYNVLLLKEIEDLKRYDYEEHIRKQIDQKERILQDLLSYKERSQKMQKAFQLIETAQWYEQLGELKLDPIPTALFSDPRYRVIFYLYRELRSGEVEVSLDSTYTYQWKRTDKIYEMWGFLQIYKTLISQELGYATVKGWLDEQALEENTVLIPSLSPGTSICLQKGDVLLKLRYDTTIPYLSEETDIHENPIYVAGVHNRPDCRIDIYNKGIFAGSLLVDFKYRRPRDFWAATKLNSPIRCREMNQLICYGSQCYSAYLFGEAADVYARDDVRPVREVWAIYPKDYENGRRYFSDHRLRLIKLCPGDDQIELKQHLQTVINDALTRYDRFVKVTHKN